MHIQHCAESALLTGLHWAWAAGVMYRLGKETGSRCWRNGGNTLYQHQTILWLFLQSITVCIMFHAGLITENRRNDSYGCKSLTFWEIFSSFLVQSKLRWSVQVWWLLVKNQSENRTSLSEIHSLKDVFGWCWWCAQSNILHGLMNYVVCLYILLKHNVGFSIFDS